MEIDGAEGVGITTILFEGDAGASAQIKISKFADLIPESFIQKYLEAESGKPQL